MKKKPQKFQKFYLVIIFILVLSFLLINFIINSQRLTTNSKAAETPLIKVFTQGDPSSNLIALTIDDCWLTEKEDKNLPRQVPLRQVFNKLKELDIPTTFFPVGAVINTSLKNKETIFKDMLTYQKSKKNLFEFQNHSYSHVVFDKNTDKRTISYQIQNWESAYNSISLEKWGAKIPKIFRPAGFGGLDNQYLFSIIQNQNIAGIAGWSIVSRSSIDRNLTAEKIAESINKSLKGGDIILMHALKEDLEALSLIKKYASKNRLKFVLLSELPGTPAYRGVKSKSKILYKNPMQLKYLTE